MTETRRERERENRQTGRQTVTYRQANRQTERTKQPASQPDIELSSQTNIVPDSWGRVGVCTGLISQFGVMQSFVSY